MQNLQSRLEVGNDIVTTSGMYGRVTAIEDDSTLLLEIAEDTDIRVARNAVGEIVSQPVETDPASES